MGRAEISPQLKSKAMKQYKVKAYKNGLLQSTQIVTDEWLADMVRMVLIEHYDYADEDVVTETEDI